MPRHILVAVLLLASLARAQQPRAYLLDHTDPWTKSAHAAELLAQAGFSVEPLPLDRSPAELDADLVFIGSFASDDPRYTPYMRRSAPALAAFAQRGRLVVQMTQADQTEASPPFLGEGLKARRCDDDSPQVRVLRPDSPLLRGITAPTISLGKTRLAWEEFAEQRGFEIVLSGDEAGQRPALMEGACGRGRIVLCSLALDKAAPEGLTPEQSHDLGALRAAFFANLRAHAAEIRAGAAAPVKPSPSTWPEPFTPGAWTLAVLPDTQEYAQHFPGLFTAQTGWLVLNRERLNIRQVIQLGDITNDSTAEEWRNARDSMRLLDGVIPYALVPGNHDYGPGGAALTRQTRLNDFFDFAEHARQPTFGGAMEPGRLENTFHLFEAGGRRWIIVCLEWGPRDETIAWANRVMQDHPDRLGILVTHAYLNNDDRRYDRNDHDHSQQYNPHEYKTPSVNDGEELWQKLVRTNNFAFVLNGHVLGDGAGYLASRNDRGFTVHQILSNYQMRQLGGEGYLRLMEFQPDQRTVRVKTWSVLYGTFLTAPDQQFELTLDQPAQAANGAVSPH
jgi:3',5'-cyclic AMP phosphodiesterase CpdA